MEWWQQMIKAGELANPLGLSEKMLELLAKDFDRFNVLDQKLPKIIINYVVDASGTETVLDQFINAASKGLNFFSTSSMKKWHRYQKASEKAEKFRAELFKLISQQNIQDVDLFCRLAKIYSAEAQVMPLFGFGTIPFGKSAHLDPFLYAIAGPIEQFMVDEINGEGDRSSLPIAISFEILAEMLVQVGENPKVLIETVFPDDAYYAANNPIAEILARHPQFGTFALKYLDMVKAALSDKEPYRRINALKILSYPTCQPLVVATKAKIIAQAIGTAKSVRLQAEAVLTEHRELLLPELQQAAVDGSAAGRLNAVNLLEKLKPEGLQAFLEQRQEQEKSAKVRSAIERILTVPIAPEEEAKPKAELLLSPLPEIQLEEPLPEHVYKRWQETLENCYASILEFIERNKDRSYYGSIKQKPLTEGKIKQTWQILQTGKLKECGSVSSLFCNFLMVEKSKKMVLQFLELPELKLIHCVRVLAMHELVHSNRQEIDLDHTIAKYVERYRQSHGQNFGLRQLAQTFKALGAKRDPIRVAFGHEYLASTLKLFLRWEEESVWPYFAENIDFLVDIFTPKVKTNPYDYDYGVQARREMGLEILAKFPTVPTELESKLWEIALGGSKKEAPQAQQIVGKLSGDRDRVFAAWAIAVTLPAESRQRNG
jgi:hypothetical protein